MAFQDLSEQIHGNRFFQPEEIQATFAQTGMTSTVHLFAQGNGAVVVTRR